MAYCTSYTTSRGSSNNALNFLLCRVPVVALLTARDVFARLALRAVPDSA